MSLSITLDSPAQRVHPSTLGPLGTLPGNPAANATTAKADRFLPRDSAGEKYAAMTQYGIAGSPGGAYYRRLRERKARKKAKMSEHAKGLVKKCHYRYVTGGRPAGRKRVCQWVKPSANTCSQRIWRTGKCVKPSK